jgi:hypothetical protein
VNRWKALRSGDLPANREAKDLAPQTPDSMAGYGVIGTTKGSGLRPVISASRGDIVCGAIQGDLAGSRVVLAHDARPVVDGWSVVHDGPIGGSVEIG